ncbi:unnamed protein product, partial [Ceratitis capitata]
MPKAQAAVRLSNKAQTNGPTEQQGPNQRPNKAARPKPTAQQSSKAQTNGPTEAARPNTNGPTNSKKEKKISSLR